MAFSSFAQITLNGLLTGGIFALIAMGLTLVFGVMDVVNFAHGAFVMLAMYLTFVLAKVAGIDPFLAILVVTPVFFVFGVVTERLVISPILDKSMFAQVFATLGLLWIFTNGADFIFGSAPRSISTGYTGITLGGIAIEEVRLYGFVIAIVTTTLLYLFLYRTKTGLAIRATAQSKELARPFGVNVSYIYMLTFGIAIALVGIAGSVSAATRPTTPNVANFFVLISFVIVTLGGLGNVTGAFLAGLFIGIVNAWVGFYLSSELAPPIYFTIFIMVLVLRSTGRFDELLYRINAALGTGGMSH